MPLILLGQALAASVYWVGTPTDADSAAVARTLPDATYAELDSLMGEGAFSVDHPGLADLDRELAACRPLLDVFDGELQIMARLEKSIADVRILRSTSQRDTVWRAMLLEGFAIQRYFQEKLPTDPAAAPYRTGEFITAWMDAAALIGVPSPSAADLPDPAAVNAYDAVQAATRSMPSLTFAAGTLARGAEMYVDGQKVPAGGRVLATPGRHYAHIEVGGTVLVARAERFSAGTTVTLSAPFGPAERDELRSLATNAGVGWTVPATTLEVVRATKEPVYLAVPGAGRPSIVRIDGGTAAPVKLIREASDDGSGFLARGAVGAGWASTGDWFLQNADAGAPYDGYTVNAGAPAASVGAGYRTGWFYAGAGADVMLPLGDFHTLPSGEGTVRAWTYIHADVGIRYAQVTVGPMFPWYLGLGVQATVPVAGPLEVFGKAVWGRGLNQAREGLDPFDPADAASAWAGVAVRLGG